LNADDLAMKETRSKLPSIELSTRVANRKANSYYCKKRHFSRLYAEGDSRLR